MLLRVIFVIFLNVFLNFFEENFFVLIKIFNDFKFDYFFFLILKVLIVNVICFFFFGFISCLVFSIVVMDIDCGYLVFGLCVSFCFFVGVLLV